MKVKKISESSTSIYDPSLPEEVKNKVKAGLLFREMSRPLTPPPPARNEKLEPPPSRYALRFAAHSKVCPQNFRKSSKSLGLPRSSSVLQKYQELQEKRNMKQGQRQLPARYGLLKKRLFSSP